MDNKIFYLGIVALLLVGALFIFSPKSNKEIIKSNLKVTPQIMKDLKVEDLKVGEGPEVKSGDIVVIHYKGTLMDGTKFDSSYDRGAPFETQIGVGNVIKGWDEGVIGMKVGGKRKLTIPPAKAYGEQGVPGAIPANATLVFELELIDIK